MPRNMYKPDESKRPYSKVRQILHVVAACTLFGVGATFSHAGGIDEVLTNFGNELEHLRNIEAQLQRPAKKSLPAYDPSAAKIKQVAGNPQDYTTHRVPLGTEVFIGGALERVLVAPHINADADVSCASMEKGGYGTNAGRVVVDEYSSSSEDTEQMKRVSNSRFKGQFTAMWARVHHVVLEFNDPVGRGNESQSCHGWVRIDSMDLYNPGTGPYPSSRLRNWVETGLTPEAKNNSTRGEMAVQTSMNSGPGPSKVVCMLGKGDSVRILGRYPMAQQTRVKVSVIVSGMCGKDRVGFVDERTIR